MLNLVAAIPEHRETTSPTATPRRDRSSRTRAAGPIVLARIKASPMTRTSPASPEVAASNQAVPAPKAPTRAAPAPEAARSPPRPMTRPTPAAARDRAHALPDRGIKNPDPSGTQEPPTHNQPLNRRYI